MPDTLRPWTILMLSAGGLFTGGLLWYAWERVWIWRRLDLGEFAVGLPPFGPQGRPGHAHPAGDLRRRGRRVRLARRRPVTDAGPCRHRAATGDPGRLHRGGRADQQGVEPV